MGIIDQKNIGIVDTKPNIKSDREFEKGVADSLEKLAIRVKEHLTLSELAVVGTALYCLRSSEIETE